MAGYGFHHIDGYGRPISNLSGSKYGMPAPALPAYDMDPDHVAERRKVVARVREKECLGVRACVADVLALHHAGMPMSEISEQLSMTVSTVHKAIFDSFTQGRARGGAA